MPTPPPGPPPELGKLLARRPVLWLGAGASRQAEPPLPTLDELAARLQESFAWTEMPADGGAYAVFDAFLAQKVGTRGDLHDFLEGQFRPGGRDVRPGPLHDHLAALAAGDAFAAILDPNYDLLLRRALQHHRVPHTASVLEHNLARPGEGLWYLSFHGSLDDWTEIVLTGESYRDFAQRHRFLQAALDLLLLRNPVLFVGASLTDPRLLDWLDALPAAKRDELKTWLAVVGPGTPGRLEETPWRDGRSVRAVLGDHLRLVELPDFATLPAWFADLAEPARRAHAAAERDFTIALTAEPDRWTFRAAGAESSHPPPDLGDDLAALRRLAGHGIPVDAAGQPLPEARSTEAALRDLALRVGSFLTALLPDAARAALDGLAASAATGGPALCRLRVDGSAADAALLLPWELLTPDSERFPVAAGELHLVREAHRPGLEDAVLPEPPPPLAVVAHLAAPEGEGLAELHLEDAAFRMAVALDRIRPRTRFTELGTLDDLAAAVREVRPTLLHFSGHGEPGHLVFEDQAGGPHRVPVNLLLGRLRQAMETLPRAVWLSCCYGAGKPEEASPSPAAATPPALTGAAREWGMSAPESASLCADLHRAGIPQVLGYFGPVPDALAVEVDRRLFEGLAETGRTLEAVRRSRLAVQEVVDTPDGPYRFPLGWSLLAVYHRGPDRLLADPGQPLPRQLSDRLEPKALPLEGVEVLTHGFIGRRRLLAELRALRLDGVRVLGLYGLGGLGKTATMTRLASLLAGGGDGWQGKVLVIPGGEYTRALAAGTGAPDPFRWLWTRFDQSLAGHPLRPKDWDALAAAADQSSDPPRELARLILAVVDGSVLYVDNAETLQQPAAEAAGDADVPWASDDLAAFFATLATEAAGDTTVLVTTRYRPANTGGVWREIPPASSGEVFRMTGWYPALRRLPPALRRELAADRLAGHPRAVQWTDALLQEAEARRTEAGGPRLSPGEDPETVRAQLLDPALAGLPAKVEADLALATLLDRLAAEPLALLGEAAAIGHPVPLAVVDRLGPGRPTLVARGLLARYHARDDRWAVHPFVRHALAARGDPGWTPAGRAVLGRYWKEHATGPTQAEEALHHLLAGELWSEAHDQMADLSRRYRDLGWYRARLALLESLTGILWPEEERCGWLYLLGTSLHEVGRYPEAERVLREVFSRGERLFGTRDHPSAFVSLGTLAHVFHSQGRYLEAESAFLEAIEVMERVYCSREHLHVATSLHGLANVLASQGRYPEAERAYQEAIEITERIHPNPDHADVASSLHGLGNVLHYQGRYAEAEHAFQKAIETTSLVYGSRKHPEVAASLHSLANVLTSQGRYPEAEQSYQESIAIKVRVYGSREHPDIASSLHGLAGVLTLQGRYPESERTYREGLDIQLQAYGSRVHPWIGIALHGLANVLAKQTRYPAAESAFRDAIEILVRVHGSREHPDIAGALSGLANTLAKQGRYVEAELAFQESIDIHLRVHGAREHPSLVTTLTDFAAILRKLDRPAEALVHLGEAWEMSLKLDSSIHSFQPALPLIHALLQSNKHERAAQVIYQARTFLARLPDDHPVRRRIEAQLDRLPS